MVEEDLRLGGYLVPVRIDLAVIERDPWRLDDDIEGLEIIEIIVSEDEIEFRIDAEGLREIFEIRRQPLYLLGSVQDGDIPRRNSDLQEKLER